MERKTKLWQKCDLFYVCHYNRENCRYDHIYIKPVAELYKKENREGSFGSSDLLVTSSIFA